MTPDHIRLLELLVQNVVALAAVVLMWFVWRDNAATQRQREEQERAERQAREVAERQAQEARDAREVAERQAIGARYDQLVQTNSESWQQFMAAQREMDRAHVIEVIDRVDHALAGFGQRLGALEQAEVRRAESERALNLHLQDLLVKYSRLIGDDRGIHGG